MRKSFAIGLLLAFLAGGAFAAQTVQLGAGYGMVNANGGVDTLASSGIGIHVAGLYGSDIGLGYSMDMAYIGAMSVNSQSYDVGKYPMRLIVNMTMGIGGKVPLGEQLYILAGAGPNFSYTSFVGDYATYGTVGFMMAEIGAGAFASLGIDFTDYFGIFIGATAAYGLYDLKLTDATLDAHGGFYLTPSAGLSFKY